MNVASFIQIFAGVAWLVFLGLIVISVMRASRNKNIKGSITILLVVLAAALVLSSVSAGLVFIQPEERGVVISAIQPTGYRVQPLQPGLRWIIPFFESVVVYPISRQTYTMSIAPSEGAIQGDDSITARTSDGQEIFVDASVIFAIDPDKVVQVHIDWQKRYLDELVRPLARGVIRDIVSQYKVEEVVTSKRVEMTTQISDGLQQNLEENGLSLVDFILRNITFSPEYAASVEQKQVAEQLAQQAVFVVEQRRQEAEQARQVAQGQADAVVINAQGAADARIIQAQAESQALQLIATALQNNDKLLLYQYINQLAPGIQVMLVPNDNPYLLTLPTLPAATSTEPTPAPTPLPTATP
ncbi:MAG: prohibitin family protein [Anaerolineales bacterium]|jgi:regulator of protease activity HflC (stomatin/prohibitin superfamily)